MGVNTKKLGFTIIETTVVLGISSMLMVAILVGSSMAVNQQRYRDSVMTLVSFVQGEYVAVTRVQNTDRSSGAGYDCSNTAQVGIGTTPRGTSDCVIIGRAINIDSGKTIKTNDVIGYRSSTESLPDGDIAALLKYDHMKLFEQGVSESEVAWGAEIVDAATSTAQTFGILLLRSPSSGNTVTFISDSPITSANVRTLVAAANIKKITMCVDSQNLFTGPRSGVIIQAGASSPNGVQQQEVGSGC